jgi:hypothetical protein
MIDIVYHRIVDELFTVVHTAEFHDSKFKNMVLYGNDTNMIYSIRKLINNIIWNFDVD